MENEPEAIARLLAAKTWAVVGASANAEKYGHRVFHDLRAFGRTAYPVNPTATEIDGVRVHARLADLPETPDAVAVIVPPHVTESVIAEIGASGARGVWMQPGAESDRAIADAKVLGLDVVAGGPCLLVALRVGSGR
jgi:uncharacterized protein